MYNIINIIKEASLYYKTNHGKLKYIKENYPEYFKVAKKFIENEKNNNMVQATVDIINNSVEYLQESCDNSGVLETEDYMTNYFGTNKNLQNVVNYLNSYEIYNLKWDDKELPINKPDKLYKQVEKQRKEKESATNKLLKDYNSLENKLNDGGYNELKGLVTEYIGYCPKCKQIAFPNHKCN